MAKGHFAGTHRIVSPEETCERVRPLMPAIGATRIANVTGLDVIGIPVVTVCRPNSRSISVSQGKGLTLAAARASALMEGLELHAAERPMLALTRASCADMRLSGRSFALKGLPLRSTRPIDEHLPLLWVEGHDLLAGDAVVWAPLSLVHTDWTRPHSADSEWLVISSNGLASGNHRLEAISHGICEVVERDATTLWYCLSDADRGARRIALGSVDDPACLEILDRFRAANVRVAAWDTTSDVGIPSFACMIADGASTGLRVMAPFGGEGCHPAREVALLRALTEAAQSRLTFIAGSRDDVRREEYRRRLDPEFSCTRAPLMNAADGCRSFLDVPTWNGASLDEDVAWELERLESVRVTQVVVVDLTDEKLQVPVVRVVVPGLEGIHAVPGYVPGPRARALLRARAS